MISLIVALYAFLAIWAGIFCINNQCDMYPLVRQYSSCVLVVAGEYPLAVSVLIAVPRESKLFLILQSSPLRVMDTQLQFFGSTILLPVKNTGWNWGRELTDLTQNATVQDLLPSLTPFSCAP